MRRLRLFTGALIIARAASISPASRAHIRREPSSQELRPEAARTQQLRLWKTYQPLAAEAGVHGSASGVHVEVYFIRHAQSTLNKQTAEQQPTAPTTAPGTTFRDAGLSELGVGQAMGIQTQLNDLAGLQGAPAGRVQLASSNSIRAFDTLVIGTAPFWTKWLRQGEPFTVHEVPAAMEFDLRPYALRKQGLADDDPVHWEDSALAGNLSLLVRDIFDPAVARDSLYQTEASRSGLPELTDKHAQVLAAYRRTRDSDCNAEQIESLVQYLHDVAMTGKTDIILSTHASLIKCFLGLQGIPGSAELLRAHLEFFPGNFHPEMTLKSIFPNPIIAIDGWS